MDQLPPHVKEKVKELKKSFNPNCILVRTQNINYLLITTGEKHTGGHKINITKIIADNDRLTVFVEDISPPKGQFVPQVITNPTLVVSLETKQKFSTVELKMSKKKCPPNQ